jgi:hypothetical protein
MLNLRLPGHPSFCLLQTTKSRRGVGVLDVGVHTCSDVGIHTCFEVELGR